MSFEARLAALRSEPSTDAGEDAARLRRVEISRAEMLCQGDAIRNTIDGARGDLAAVAALFSGRPLRRVVIIGCGDSLGIGMACRLAFERFCRVPAEPAQALDYALYSARETADSETLVIGISASGTTEAVVDGLAAARAQGAATVAVSNIPTSPIAAAADRALVVQATRKGWPTQSSTATVALLCSLAAALAEQRGTAAAADIARLRADIASLPALVDVVASRLDEATRTLAERFATVPILLFAGAGPHRAAAHFGAAKIKELGPIHAVSLALEEYHHYRSQKPGDVLFLIAPDHASHARALDTALVGRAVGGHTVALLPEGETAIASLVDTPLFLPAVRPELASVVYSVPLHLFSYHFAKARFARKLGYRPDNCASAAQPVPSTHGR